MKRLLYILMALFVIPMLPGCAVVGGIFKAGMGFGIFLVVVVVGGLIFLLTRGKGK